MKITSGAVASPDRSCERRVCVEARDDVLDTILLEKELDRLFVDVVDVVEVAAVVVDDDTVEVAVGVTHGGHSALGYSEFVKMVENVSAVSLLSS